MKATLSCGNKTKCLWIVIRDCAGLVVVGSLPITMISLTMIS